jgi:hypothetical protein
VAANQGCGEGPPDIRLRVVLTSTPSHRFPDEAIAGHQINTVMSAVGYNLRLILKWLRKLLGKIIIAIWAVIMSISTLKTAS